MSKLHLKSKGDSLTSWKAETFQKNECQIIRIQDIRRVERGIGTLFIGEEDAPLEHCRLDSKEPEEIITGGGNHWSPIKSKIKEGLGDTAIEIEQRNPGETHEARQVGQDVELHVFMQSRWGQEDTRNKGGESQKGYPVWVEDLHQLIKSKRVKPQIASFRHSWKPL